MMVLSEKEWYTTKEVQELTGEDSRLLTRKIRDGLINDYKKEGTRYYIQSTYIQEVIQQKKYIEENYICYAEIAKRLNITLKALHDRIYSDAFKDIYKKGNVSYISKKEFEDYIEKRNKYTSGEYITSTYVMDVTGLERYEVRNLISKGYLNGEKDNKVWRISKESFEGFLIKARHAQKVSSLCDRFQLSDEDITRYKLNSWLKTYCISEIGEIILDEDYENFMELKNKYYTIHDLAKLMGLKVAVIRNSLIFTGVLQTERTSDGMYLIQVEEVERFSKTLEYVKLSYHGKKDNYRDYFNDFLTALAFEFSNNESIEIYRKWVMNKVNNSNNKRKKLFISYYLHTAEKFFSNIKNEVWELTNEQIFELLNGSESNLTSKDTEIIFGFLSYCKGIRECQYSDDYSTTTVTNKRKDGERIYSKQEWVQMCTHLTDIQFHFDKAIENRRYANTWLLLLLHLSLAWRLSDFNKIPAPSLGIVGIKDFQWFDSNNFTLEMAQLIINDVKMKSKGIRTDKTGSKTKFVIGLIMPTALAFIISELHSSSGLTLEKSRFSKLRSHNFKLVLGEKLPSFSSRKANRTLMTYQFETAVNQEGKAHIAYQLSSFSRAHKTYMDKPNDITSVYLVTTNTDASAENMAKHLFERGFFGWQVGMLLKLISNENISLEEQSNMIKEVGQQISPLAVESMSEYVNTKHEEAQELLKELMALPAEDIRNKLEEIAKFQSPALIDYSQCIKGVENCPYTTSKACLGCKYLLPTNYVLELVRNELFDLLERLGSVSQSNTVKRVKFTHMINKLMFILMDFKKAYKQFDENYISSFIDMPLLKEKYEKMESEKFLKLR